MNEILDRAKLTKIVRDAIHHAKARTVAQVPEVMTIPASNYFDPGRFKREVDLIFKRLPLMLAPSAQMPKPGDYKTMDVVGIPVLLTRGEDGVVRGFLNSCSHRGTNVATQPTGNAKRFICPYHGWTFGQKGDLIGVASPNEFGEVDKSCLGLRPLKVAERAGLIWAILSPDSSVDIDRFLCGYDRVLSNFNFGDWHLFASRTLKGPNWKIAYDGYLDFYHLPVLHKATFGPEFTNQALYYAWGPHQRVQSPARELIALEGVPESEWTEEALFKSWVWTIFPHISIAPFGGPGAGTMISQLFPGDAPGESYTTQYYLLEKPPTEKGAREAEAQFGFLEYVVREEDYATGLRQQRALESGARTEVLFGRNEGGAQSFHRWLDRILATPDADLDRLFGEAAGG